VQDRPKIDYERLLPVETPADQVSGIIDFRDERVRDVTTQAATALDVPSLIDSEALLEFDSSTGRISGGLADLDDQSLVARLRVKSG
jgi:hypothetical protein